MVPLLEKLSKRHREPTRLAFIQLRRQIEVELGFSVEAKRPVGIKLGENEARKRCFERNKPDPDRADGVQQNARTVAH
ncbi:MAG TPA: hypothetical protein VGI19_19820 [Candidatus Cybelea sp.]